MTRTQFEKLVAQALDSLPAKYRALLENVVVMVEDLPHGQGAPEDMPDDENLLMGEYIGVPRTERRAFDAPVEPDRVVLYQKNIEAYSCDAAEEEDRPVEEIIREEVRLTVLHELGHFFGMEEDQLDDV